ncbi:MAG: GNAT family N-acetyltransferase [Roseibium sp.]|uniref:GNAT family N-acetyltransferase n=1 Tax=Roseibium sp. TaxID=1936156 RepID=UPI002612A6BD|nr:GNAT family N-acetyltransferase [Roseibium sp.]MCV0424548.1 GNAT family N-acetyltransferase [Roseibium sp.]
MIRPYVSEDTDAILHIWRIASEFAHPFLDDDFHDMAANAIRDVYLPKADTFVVVIDDVPVGFIALLENQIGGLFLDPAFHGQGLGRSLVDHAVKLKGPLTVEVFKNNKVGRRFYAAYGFHQTGECLHDMTEQLTLKLAMVR